MRCFARLQLHISALWSDALFVRRQYMQIRACRSHMCSSLVRLSLCCGSTHAGNSCADSRFRRGEDAFFLLPQVPCRP